MSGTRLDATPFLVRGVIVFGVRDERALTARFYLEPVEVESPDVAAAVHAMVGPAS
jgi:hypothetical protein